VAGAAPDGREWPAHYESPVAAGIAKFCRHAENVLADRGEFDHQSGPDKPMGRAR
jgi:hypothetical protein